ncbi:MAG: hypothetical protein IRZ16_14210 [Myxococcaceae bacterium]|nr:hypothetical protein [Myxococcaceae bacterium]
MRIALHCAAVGLGAVFLSACGSNVCDTSEAFDPSSKVGDCSVEVPARVLGSKSSCNGALGSCSDADKKILEGIMSCWDALPVCASGDQAAWVDQSNGCYDGAANLSESCRNAFFGDGIPGGQEDGGTDAGVIDAGPQPDTDGGGALDLVLTANESSIAMAWVKSQEGVVDHWEVHPLNAADIAEPVATVTPGEKLFYEEAVSAGVKKKYFVVGFNAAGEVATGSFPMEEMDAGTDAGMCNGPLDCPPEQVCNLGACQELPCTDSNVCPGGYVCDLQTDHRCERIFGFGDGGVDGGTSDAGVQDKTPRPFISELGQISTPQTAAYSADRVVSAFPSLNVDLEAVDTARQFMILEQEGQIFGYFTEDRGKTWRTIPVDPIGTHPKVVYEPQSRTMFACYNAFGGVRVRSSSDFGKTWKPAALDLVNPPSDDGGIGDAIQGCAMAPWQEGQILLTAVDGDRVVLWTVNKDLTLTMPDPEVVFTSTESQFAPKELDLATLPSDFIVHVLFTFSRPTTTSPDTEIADYYRDPGTGGFVYKPVHNQNGFDQSQPTVVVDPVTKRAVAAFTSNESTGGPKRDTIYLSFWTPSKVWATGSDLNIFAKNSLGTEYVNFPERKPGEDWIARSPSLAASKDGKIVLAFAAGEMVSTQPSLQVWSIPFSFDAQNVIIPAIKGYYAADASLVSPTRVVKPASQDTGGPVIAADEQISFYYGFVEGVGAMGDVANRPVIVSFPK